MPDPTEQEHVFTQSAPPGSRGYSSCHSPCSAAALLALLGCLVCGCHLSACLLCRRLEAWLINPFLCLLQEVGIHGAPRLGLGVILGEDRLLHEEKPDHLRARARPQPSGELHICWAAGECSEHASWGWHGWELKGSLPAPQRPPQRRSAA